jgi:RNA polymerase sigma factor (sigma-70 family)
MSEIADLDTAQARALGTATTAFEQLYAVHRLTLLRFLVAFTSDQETALEIAAITFERAWSECRRGRQIGLGWLLRSARNAAIDASRREAVRSRFLRAGVGSPTAASAEDVVIRRDSDRALRVAVGRLPSPQREAVALRFTTTLRVREIAEIVGKREDATEKLISRALAILREELHDRP